MEHPPTPRVKMLLEKLNGLTLDLQKDMNRLVTRLETSEEVLVLSAATHNIVDRKAEKKRHQKSYTVTLKEIVDSGIDYEQLQ
jgi:hypothetical protein